MAQQRLTRAPQVEIDCIVIREVQYQLEAILGGCGLCGRGAPGLVMGLCIVEIDRVVIRIVQYQLEVNRLKGNFVWVWPIWVGCPRIARIVIREVQYQLEVNRCRNEEVIVKGNFAWVWPMWVGAPGLIMGLCIVEIDRIVIREFQGSSAYSVGGVSGQDGQTDGLTAEITTISPRSETYFGRTMAVEANLLLVD
ncbi:hypothetical protein DPMN_016032 [Dreissena polymorpha]|uniref:Uncharacterized protein n=1 Tax=Dreissena polymorpha TaxID=45954 RepID=A0A9D4N8X7_DREPO|nr:hypothetical protein DPMN_016032 [Dreissena polymorpha]